MYLNVLIIILLWFGWTNIASVLLILNVIITMFGKRIFAKMLSKFCHDYNVISDSLKVDLFNELNEMEPSNGKSLQILEIGGGSGANFKYFTSKAEVEVIEPNPHFVQYFEVNRSKFPELDIQDMKQGYGEDLSAAGVADESVDVVVMTLVLCSVQDQEKCLAEIVRVLKPGGKFFYMEHILAGEGRVLRKIQQLVMSGGFWEFIGDGCCADRQTDKLMANSPLFSKVDQTTYDLPLPNQITLNTLVFSTLGQIVQPHVRGVATK